MTKPRNHKYSDKSAPGLAPSTNKYAAQYIFPRVAHSQTFPARREELIDDKCDRVDFVLTVKTKGD